MKKTEEFVMKQITILLVDDQILLRDALQTIFNLEEDMSVVGVASNGKEAYELVNTLNPDIVLMDIKMPVMNGVEAIKSIKRDFPNTLILMLSTFADEDQIIECLAHGALGYLLKDMNGDRLVSSVRDAANGHHILPSKVAAKLAARLYQTKENQRALHSVKVNNEELTEREKEIASLIMKGLTNREIAATLFIGEGTVRNYISNLYSKVGTNDRSKLLLYLQDLDIS
jgi:DNA-binding NarL/FixJ family response regulator